MLLDSVGTNSGHTGYSTKIGTTYVQFMDRGDQELNPGELIRASRSIDARRRYFSNGQLAIGEVPNRVLRSWMRCRDAGLDAHRAICFEPVGRATLRDIEERSRTLVNVAQSELALLATAVANAGMIVMLTDASGTMVESAGDFRSISPCLKLAARKGVDFGEGTLGTNALGTALVEQSAIAIVAQEHYFDANAIHTCVAAPLFAPDGALIGALDVSGDYSPQRSDVFDLVVTSARAIENRLVHALTGATLLSFSAREDLLSTPWEGIIALDPESRLVGANATARALLGLNWIGSGAQFDDLFDSTFDQALRSMAQREGVWTLQTRSGLRVAARLQHPAASRRTVAPSGARRLLPAGDAAKRSSTLAFLDVVSRDPATARAFARARSGYDRAVPVLLVGETGTGKELFAQALHHLGPRSNGPFIAVNCAALPETLVEAELFGHTEGAFTGARRGGAQGRLELANGGTLFLDEIGDMPLTSQAKLLRVLQERSVMRLGDNQERPIDVALVCATHQDLSRLIVEKTFREDLFYRVNGLCVTLPPLRDRANIADLAKYLLSHQAMSGGSQELSDTATHLLLSHPWPGNLRQLSHVIASAVALCKPQGPIEADDFPEDFAAEVERSKEYRQCAPASKDELVSLEQAEALLIERTVQVCQGNMSAAARALKVSRSTLYNKLKRD